MTHYIFTNSNFCQRNKKTANKAYCCKQFIAHDVIKIWRAQIIGERIFTGAQLCNEISAVDNDGYVC